MNLALIEASKALNARAMEVPRFGSLWGQDGITDEDWILGNPEVESEFFAVFSVASTDAAIRFWGEVAQLGNEVLPDVQFVGVCDDGAACATRRHSDGFPLLAYMDPIQMQALSIARNEELVLLYLGHVLAGTVRIVEDPNALLSGISDLMLTARAQAAGSDQ